MSPSTSPEKSPSTPTVDTQGPRDTDALYMHVQKDQKLSPAELRIFHEKFISTGKKTITENTGDELDRLLAGISDPEKNNIKNAVSTYLPTSTKPKNPVDTAKSTLADTIKDPSAALAKAKEVADTAKEGISEAAKLAALGTSMAAISVAGTQVANGDTKAIGGLVKGIKEVADTVWKYSHIGQIMRGLGEISTLIFTKLGDIWKGIMSFFGVDIGDSAGTADGADTPEAKAKADADKKKEVGGNNIPEKTDKDLQNIEYRNMRDATWRNMLRMNTKTITPVDTTKRKEFDARIDTYIQESGIADTDIAGKKTLLEKIQKALTDTQSLSSLMGLSLDIQKSASTTPNVAASAQALSNFTEGLKKDKIIRLESLMEGKVFNAAVLYMEEQGWITPADKERKMKLLRERFQTEKYKKIIADTEKMITQDEKVYPVSYIGKLLIAAPGVVWDLLVDIIPITALTVYAVSNGFTFGLRGVKALTTKGFDDALSVLSGEKLDENMKIPEEKRLLVITMLYQQGHLTAALAGYAARVMTTAALMPLYWSQGTTVTSAHMQFNQARGNYEAMAKNLHTLTRDMLTPEQYKQMSAFDTHLRGSMIRIEAKLHIADIFKNQPHLSQDAVYTEVSNRMSGHIGKNKVQMTSILADFKKSTTIPSVGGLHTPMTVDILNNHVFNDTSGKTTWIQESIRNIKGAVMGPSEKSVSMGTVRIENNINGVLRDHIGEGKIVPWMYKWISLFGGTVPEMIENMNKGQIILNMNEKSLPADIKNLKNHIKDIPAGVQNVFSGLNLLIVGGLVKNAKDGEKFTTLCQGALAAHPFGAVYVFATEGTSMKTHKFENPAYFSSLLLSMGFAGMEIKSIVSNARTYGVGTAIGKSAVGPYKVLASIPKGTWHMLNGTSSINRQGISAVMSGSKKPLLMTLGIVATMLTVGKVFEWWDTKKMKEYTDDISNRMLLNPDGSVDWKKVSGEISTYTKDKKESAIKLAIATYLGDNSTYPKITENNVDILIQPSADTSRHMTYGIVDSTEMDGLKTVLTQLGYTATIAYTTDADAVISAQAKKLLSEGYTQEQVDILNKQIRWTPVTVLTQSSGKNVSPSNLEEPTTSVSLGA